MTGRLILNLFLLNTLLQLLQSLFVLLGFDIAGKSNALLYFRIRHAESP